MNAVRGIIFRLVFSNLMYLLVVGGTWNHFSVSKHRPLHTKITYTPSITVKSNKLLQQRGSVQLEIKTNFRV